MHQIYWETDMQQLIFGILIFISVAISDDETYVVIVSFDGLGMIIHLWQKRRILISWQRWV